MEDLAKTYENDNMKEIEAYIRSHDIQQLLKDSIIQLCLHRPENPFGFLRQHFEKLDRVSCVNFLMEILEIWFSNLKVIKVKMLWYMDGIFVKHFVKMTFWS